MYVGAHLPLDLVGGSALGLALGSTVNLVTARRRAPAAQDLASV
jgi:membrane-associated phospholipid phosphatase